MSDTDPVMRGKLGINLDYDNPSGRPDPQLLGPFGWARLVARPDPGFGRYVDELQAAGLRTLLVLGNESFSRRDWTAETRAFAERLRPDCWQIGNEPDGRPPASWTMPPEAYAALALACVPAIRHAQPGAVIIGAGLTGGDAAWLARCGSLPLDGVAVHPYGRRPYRQWLPPPWRLGTVDGLLGRYARYGRPLWVTEFGTDNQATQARYDAAVYAILARRPDVVAACAFCYADAMVPGFGLVDASGARKPAYAALAAVVEAETEEGTATLGDGDTSGAGDQSEETDG